MNNVVTVTDVIDAFKQQGFYFVCKTDDGWFKLQGQLLPPNADKGYLCEIQIDPEFFDLPRIRLLDIPPELPKTLPHLGANGDLCYLAKGTIVLDIYDPLGQSLACLQRAAEVFGQILQGEMIEGLAEEFFAYWNGWLCFSDMQNDELGRQNCIVAEAANGKPFLFITDNADRTTIKLSSLGFQIT
uniref:E2/UBC family protein n=1 Tax=Aeromonas sp. HMWF015 TaxID=2056851 RepID=UPI000D3F20C3